MVLGIPDTGGDVSSLVMQIIVAHLAVVEQK